MTQIHPTKEGRKVKTTLIALSATALIAVGPAVLAQNVPGKTPVQQHHASRTHHRVAPGYAHTIQARGSKTGHPGAFGYVPSQPKDYTYENSSVAGGGGGGGGGGSGM
jgi:hypothetical protein